MTKRLSIFHKLKSEEMVLLLLSVGFNHRDKQRSAAAAAFTARSLCLLAALRNRNEQRYAKLTEA